MNEELRARLIVFWKERDPANWGIETEHIGSSNWGPIVQARITIDGRVVSSAHYSSNDNISLVEEQAISKAIEILLASE